MTAPGSRSTATTTIGLQFDVARQLGTLDLRVALDVAPGEVVAILGPNGAGKTTLLRVLAGLLPVGGGWVSLDGHVLEDVDAGVRFGPQQRGVGMVFQEHLLFPNLTALENVAFGLRSRGVQRTEARRRALEWLGRVGLPEAAHVKPRALSGGQAQRVALARALATDPALLLLDEPLSSLDVDTRRVVRRQMRHHLDAFEGPVLLVTHDPGEAMTLADRLVILEQGRVVQIDVPSVIARRPRSPWAARLVGLNHYRGRVEGNRLTLDTGGHLMIGDAVEPAHEVFVAISPRAVALSRHRPGGPTGNTWLAMIDDLDIHDDQARVYLDGPVPIVAQIAAAVFADLALGEGAEVWVTVETSAIDHWPGSALTRSTSDRPPRTSMSPPWPTPS